MSASPKMIIGPLPPSSSITCLPAARRATEAPVAVEPTNPTPSTSGWPATSSPTSAPGPVTRFTAPGGKSPSADYDIAHPEASGIPSAELPPAFPRTPAIIDEVLADGNADAEHLHRATDAQRARRPPAPASGGFE